jgi:hypothetical protein
MRITFTFPKGYPNRASDPSGNTSKTVPKIELEKSPLISIQDRTYILERLNKIKERQRPCLEACLRFLLFGEEYDLDRDEKQMGLDGESESSSEDENPTKRMPRDPTVNMVHKNISEPRTSQGYFAPNGEKLCHFYECISSDFTFQANWYTSSVHLQGSYEICLELRVRSTRPQSWLTYQIHRRANPEKKASHLSHTNHPL